MPSCHYIVHKFVFLHGDFPFSSSRGAGKGKMRRRDDAEESKPEMEAGKKSKQTIFKGNKRRQYTRGRSSRSVQWRTIRSRVVNPGHPVTGIDCLSLRGRPHALLLDATEPCPRGEAAARKYQAKMTCYLYFGTLPSCHLEVVLMVVSITVLQNLKIPEIPW